MKEMMTKNVTEAEKSRVERRQHVPVTHSSSQGLQLVFVDCYLNCTLTINYCECLHFSNESIPNSLPSGTESFW